MRKVGVCLVLVAGFAAAHAGRAQTKGDALRASLARLAAEAEGAERTVLAGQHGWLFLVEELRHLGAGRFWGADAVRASRSAKPEWADPLPAILDFRDQLRRAGIELLLVPVPPRAAVAPRELPEIDAAGAGRLDAADAEFYALLRQQGAEVLDLQPEFAAAAPRPAICRTDSHWSGEGLAIAAARIAEHVRKQPWYAAAAKGRFVSETRELEIRGDLLRMLGDAAQPPERLALRFVSREGDASGAPVAADPASPLLLLSDSHGLVFGAGGDLYARGAGLPDQLALELGLPVDLVAVRGAPSNAGRMQLARRKGGLAGKKLVVWVFGARYFTDAQGWAKVPVLR